MLTALVFLVMSQAPQVSSVGSCVVTGRVTISGSHSPVRRAKLVISKTDSRPSVVPITLDTDVFGGYCARGIGAGNYRITISKPGFISISVTFRIAEREGSSRTAPEAAGVALDLSLQRAAAISGRIISPSGEAIEGVALTAVSVSDGVSGSRALGTECRTDDLGRYRLHTLSPGEYVIVATSPSNGRSFSVDERPVARVYYPDSVDMPNARRFPVRTGQEIVLPDFVLRIQR